jgi:predicted choloylglycine hydrolase
VSKESIVIPPAKTFEHPQLKNLSSQTITAENGTIKFGKSKKYVVNNIKIVSLRGSPYEIGFAHGKLLKEEIAEYLKYYAYIIRSRSLGTDIGVNLLKKRAKIVEKNIPAEYLEELHGISAGSNIDYDLLLMYNALPTIAYSFSGYACSSFAFRGENSKVIHSRGFDFSIPESLSGRVLFTYKPASGNGFFCIERPGMISAWTGMNEKGITFGLHALYGIRLKTWDTIPYSIQRRKILQYSDTIDDVEKIIKQQSAYPITMYLVSSNEGAAVFELANDKIARIDMANNYLALSNHSRTLNSMRYESTTDRLSHLNEYLEKNSESMNIEKAISLNRTPLISRPTSKYRNQHSVIFSPNDLYFWVAMSQKHRTEPACFGTYTGFNLLKLIYGHGQAPNPAYFPAKN